VDRLLESVLRSEETIGKEFESDGQEEDVLGRDEAV